MKDADYWRDEWTPPPGVPTWHVHPNGTHNSQECAVERCGQEPAQSPNYLAPQTVEGLSNELCVGAEPDQPTKTQDELLTALDELLDSALHDDACYIHENDTECVCVIGKVRAALPPCGATYRPAHPQRGDRVVQCHRNAHPASPDRHVF
jgi:hypothetical protein